jgi:hypothetical protein
MSYHPLLSAESISFCHRHNPDFREKISDIELSLQCALRSNAVIRTQNVDAKQEAVIDLTTKEDSFDEILFHLTKFLSVRS